MDQLEKHFGKSERRLREDFHYLEEINFLIIRRPKKYSRGLSNHYSLNYALILETASQHRKAKRSETKRRVSMRPVQHLSEIKEDGLSEKGDEMTEEGRRSRLTKIYIKK